MFLHDYFLASEISTVRTQTLRREGNVYPKKKGCLIICKTLAPPIGEIDCKFPHFHCNHCVIGQRSV